MKKYIFAVLCFMVFMANYKGLSKFYTGYKVDNLRVAKNKNGTIVYSYLKTIHKSDTDELAYCVQPGVDMTLEDYEEYEGYNEKFKIDTYKMEKVKLLAKYGYLYKDHTDIRWYAATQYLIWRAVMPTTWDIYFVDENNNRLDSLFINEINEINSLVSMHHDQPDVNGTYEFNYQDDIIIEDDNNLLEYYYPSSGEVRNNKIYLGDNLEPGDYTYRLNIIDTKKPMFYNHPTGQDLFTRGEIYKSNIEFNVHIAAGNLKINECDEKTFKNELIGGTYEVLDQDDAVVDEITCNENEECLSKILPTGYYKIRVKNLGDDYEINDSIYDVSIYDKSSSEVSVCSLKKDKSINIYNIDNSKTFINNNINIQNIFNNIVQELYNKEYEDNSITEVINDNTKYTSVNNTIDNTNDFERQNNIDIKNENVDHIVNNCLEKSSDYASFEKKLIGYNNDNSNIKTVSVPNTGKSSYLLLIVSPFLIFIYYLAFLKHEDAI